MKTTALEITQDLRKVLLKHQKRAFEQVQLAQKEDNFDDLMFAIMGWSFWIRVGMELLLRTAYWQNLSRKDLGARFLSDQQNLFITTLKRLELPKKMIEQSMKEFDNISVARNVCAIRPEGNEEILKKITYRKKELNKLYNAFYKILSKLSHPDPYFICFPDKYRLRIETNLTNILKKCETELESEWKHLTLHLKNALTL